jgi:prepilin-type processing-associated H-X9-DG protein
MTRLEVLALLVIAIPVLGLGIIQLMRAREAAAKEAECRNNLRQLGMALHNYHDTNDAFPTEAGSRPSIFSQILIYQSVSSQIGTIPQNARIPVLLCPWRRTVLESPAKRDYGYAASTGAGSAGSSILDSPVPVKLGEVIHDKGTDKTLLLTHLWMHPKQYGGGDPTDLGWATKNNSRPVNDVAKQDSDPSGNSSHLGSIHPNAMPCLFADGHVQSVPYDWPHWSKAWAYDNMASFPLP